MATQSERDDPDTWSLPSESVVKHGVVTPTVIGLEDATPKEIQLDRVRTETAEIDAELLRGVSLRIALSGFGKHWKLPSLTSMHEIQQNCAYDLSFRAIKFHHFLSHDWKTSRWAKYGSMLLLFNLPAATRATFLAAILLGVYIGPMPHASHNLSLAAARFLPWLVFVFVFCFWQNLRSVFRRPLVVFLDKLCIAQHDPVLKAKGIRGLSTFLDRSEELTILWSSRYFTRLWCVYELATFLRRGHTRPVKLFPVAMAWVLLLQTGAVGGAIIMIELGKGFGNQAYAQTFWSFLFGALWAILMKFPLQYLLLGVMADVLVLEEQFKHFSIQKSQCFCCTSDHRHPDTGETLMCDRKFVYEAVRTWYKFDKAGEEETWEHFEKFDQVVRTTLRRKVMEGANSAILPFRIILCLALVVTAPNLVELMTLEVEKGFGRPDLVYRVWRVIGWTSYVWVRTLVSILVDIGVSIKLSKWCSRFLKSMSRLKVAAAASVLQVLLVVITLGAMHLWDLLWTVDGSVDWFPLVMAAWLLFITWLYGVGPCHSARP